VLSATVSLQKKHLGERKQTYIFKRGNPSLGHRKLILGNESIDFNSYNGFFNRTYIHSSSPKGFKFRGVFNG